MGVSGLLRNVIEKYPNTIYPAPNPNISIDYLYLDFNSFIYKAIHAFPQNVFYDFSNEKQTEKFEEKLVKLVVDITVKLVNKMKPKKLVYIAIDGPPPLAKMVQQRERRYKRPLIKQILKNNDPSQIIAGSTYDDNRITPGTVLMDLLNKEFEKAISKKKFKKVSVVFDGSNNPGEAEHKYLKLIEGLIDDPKENHVIFSNDGDEIFLSLKFPRKNIYVMMNADATALKGFFKETQEYAYLDAKKLGDSYFQMYGISQFGGRKLSNNEKLLLKTLTKNSECGLNNTIHEDKEAFLKDFIFMSFLEGNDFVKPIYFLKFNQDKMRTPLSIYRFQRKMKNDSNFRLINSDFSINQTFLFLMMKRLGEIENEKFMDIKRNIEKKISLPPIKRNLDNVFEHKFYTNQDHYLHEDYVQQFDFLFGDMPNFKQRYYEYFFGKDYKIDKICEDFLRILEFNVNYYFGIEVNWDTFYNEAAAPLPSDLAHFLHSNPGFFKTLKLPQGNPVEPFVLLAYVLPPQSMTKGTIPEKYRDELLKKYPQYFPERIPLKLMQPGGKLIYAEPHLENPPISILEKILSKIKLTSDEKERNTLKEESEIFIFK